jgi:hypothetical protein
MIETLLLCKVIEWYKLNMVVSLFKLHSQFLDGNKNNNYILTLFGSTLDPIEKFK